MGVLMFRLLGGKRHNILRLEDLQFAHVIKNETLVKMDGEKYSMKHILRSNYPRGMTYIHGISYLQVLWTNDHKDSAL
jgi:hypothetical protein